MTGPIISNQAQENFKRQVINYLQSYLRMNDYNIALERQAHSIFQTYASSPLISGSPAIIEAIRFISERTERAIPFINEYESAKATEHIQKIMGEK